MWGIENCEIVFLGCTSYSLVQTLLQYDVSFTHNPQRRRQTVGQSVRQTDDSMMLTADKPKIAAAVGYIICYVAGLLHVVYCGSISMVVLVVQWFGVGLVIERSLVRLPAGALSSQLGQLSLPSLRGR